MKAVIAEIRRREVLRVTAVYAVGAWLVLQIAEVTAEPLGFPPWTLRALIIGSVVGFPVVFFLAWVIRIEPEGLLFDLPLWRGDSAKRIEQKTDYVVVACVTALLLIGAYTVGMKVFRDMPVETQRLASDSFVLVEAPPNSIAVMAFENYGGTEDAEHFGSGLAEEILNMLAGLRELNVAARTSSFQFRGQLVDIRDVARTLSVRYVLEGSVRHSGDTIRVNAKLIDGADGYNAFSKTYERQLQDIFAIQEEIAASVVNELKIALSVVSEERLQKKPTEDIGAYVFYLQGVERLRSPKDIDVLEAAGQLFRSALDIDPEFSRAYAGICETHLNLYEMANGIEDFDKAKDACSRAAELDPGLGSETRIALGTLYRYRGWYERAADSVRQAIAISPTAVEAYIEMGEIHMAEGRRDEAEATFLRAADLKKNYWRAFEALGHFYYKTERYADAARYFELASRLTPESASGYSALGAAYWMLGESEQARIAYNRSLELKPTRRGYTNMGLRYYYAGDFSAAVEMQKKALEIAPDDHRLWGRLAESHRFIPGHEAESAAAYARAAELAEANLKINQLDWDTMGLLGLYYTHLGQIQKGLNLVDKSVAVSQRNAGPLYYQALARLQTGDQDGAIDALAEAVAADEQYRQFIETDPDFQPIRDNGRLAQLLQP